METSFNFQVEKNRKNGHLIFLSFSSSLKTPIFPFFSTKILLEKLALAKEQSVNALEVRSIEDDVQQNTADIIYLKVTIFNLTEFT